MLQGWDDELEKVVGIFATGNAAHVVDRLQVPRAAVVPEISGTPGGTLKADAADGKLACIRVTINPGDAVEAASRLANGQPEVISVHPDSEIMLSIAPDGSDGEITSVYIEVVGDGTGTDAGGDNIIDSSAVKSVNGQLTTTVGTVAMPDATEAELSAATNVVALTFSAASKVRDVNIGMGPLLATDTEAYITVEGRSYA